MDDCLYENIILQWHVWPEIIPKNFNNFWLVVYPEIVVQGEVILYQQPLGNLFVAYT